MLETIVIISLFCNGLHIVTRPGMLLGGVRNFIEEFLFLKHPQQTWRNVVYKPVLGCIKCMASVWGALICLLVMPWQWELLWQIPVICICASALNAILFQLYE